MEQIKTITQPELAELITKTKKSLFICLPSLHREIADAIVYLSYLNSFEKTEVQIHILLDFDAQTIRQGYGDFEALDELLKGGFEIRTLKDNRISFIISDEIGYYLFVESRSLIPADKPTINAIQIDPISIVRLKKFFFNDAVKMNFEDELTNAIIEESKQLENARSISNQNIATIEEVTDEKLKAVKEDLEKNPPLHPDFKRLVEFYSNKFQYVKLKFEGANLKSKKIEIPSKALPILDSNLKKKLATKLNLFDANNTEAQFPSLQEIKDQLEEIREYYLTKVKSREERLLRKEQKIDFLNQLKTIEKKLPELKDLLINQIADLISETRNQLLSDLTDLFIENPKAVFPKHPNLWEGNKAYLQTESEIEAFKIVSNLNWPKAHELVNEFKIDVQFSDITLEDLKNEKFISEALEAGLITELETSQLAEFKLGISTN